MIGSLARKRTNVVALAVLLAMVATMFVMFTPAQVQAHDLGTCSNPEYLTETACEDATRDDDPATDGIQVGVWAAGTHTASNHRPSVTVSFGDSDGIVAPGGTVKVHVTISGLFATEGTRNVAEAGSANILYVRASGELDHPSAGAIATADAGWTATVNPGDDLSAVTATVDLIVPEGTTLGDYTISTRVQGYPYGATTAAVEDDPQTDDDEGDENDRLTLSDSATLTVGEAGVGLSTATLALGNRVKENTATVKEDVKAESGSDDAEGDGINLVVTASNSLGNKSNNGDVSQITVIAPGGKIEIGTDDGDEDAVGGTDTDSATASGVGQLTRLKVAKADGKPGTVDVYAILTGPSGAAVSETLTLNFTGDASSLTLGEASGTLHSQVTADEDDNRDVISFALSATDSGGNNLTAGIPSVQFRVTNEAGASVATTDISRAQGANAVGIPNAKITLTSLKEAPAALKAGEYTLKVIAGENSAEQTFSVTGVADAISASAESNTDPVQLGSLITVTATVTSGDINVAEKTAVNFTTAGALKLVSVDKDGGATASGVTKAGVATAQYVVSEGTGHASIIVSAGNASTTASVSVGAAAAEAEEVTLDCLSETAGFATYTCGVDSSASELFALVSGRGATAIHLWNGSAWVRYSVVNGNEVPGSTDFLVTDNDILYVSN